MYTLLKSVALSAHVGAAWEEIDAGPRIVSSLFQSYRDIVLQLGTETGEPIWVSLLQLKPIYGSYDNTLLLLLQNLEGYGFDVLSGEPSQKVKYVKYGNAHSLGYHLRLTKAGFVLPSEAPPEDKPDVLIRRDGPSAGQGDRDLSQLHDYCLPSINGYLHNTVQTAVGPCVIDGGITMRHAQNNSLGLLSFLELGKLDKITLTPERVGKAEGRLSLKERIEITLPEGKTIKSFFLVLGGYLVLPQKDVLWSASDRTIQVNLKALSYLERLLESSLYLDLSALKLTPSEQNDTMLNLEEIWSDAVITRYFTLSQSFVVLVEQDQLFYNRIPLRQLRVPGQFTAYQEPEYPLVLGTGRFAEYWKQREGDRWSVTMSDSYRRMYMHHREMEGQLKNVFDQLSFDIPHFFSQGYLLEIGAYQNKE